MAQKTLIEALKKFYDTVVSLGIDKTKAYSVLKKAIDVVTKEKNIIMNEEGTFIEIKEKAFNELLNILENKAKALTKKTVDENTIFFDKKNITRFFEYNAFQDWLFFMAKDMTKKCEYIRVGGPKKKS